MDLAPVYAENAQFVNFYILSLQPSEMKDLDLPKQDHMLLYSRLLWLTKKAVSPLINKLPVLFFHELKITGAFNLDNIDRIPPR